MPKIFILGAASIRRLDVSMADAVLLQNEKAAAGRAGNLDAHSGLAGVSACLRDVYFTVSQAQAAARVRAELTVEDLLRQVEGARLRPQDEGTGNGALWERLAAAERVVERGLEVLAPAGQDDRSGRTK